MDGSLNLTVTRGRAGAAGQADGGNWGAAPARARGGPLRPVLSGPSMAPLMPGQGPSEGVFLSGRADVVLGYCSGVERVRRTVLDLVGVPLPPNLAAGLGSRARSRHDRAVRQPGRRAVRPLRPVRTRTGRLCTAGIDPCRAAVMGTSPTWPASTAAGAGQPIRRRPVGLDQLHRRVTAGPAERGRPDRRPGGAGQPATPARGGDWRQRLRGHLLAWRPEPVARRRHAGPGGLRRERPTAQRGGLRPPRGARRPSGAVPQRPTRQPRS